MRDKYVVLMKNGEPVDDVNSLDDLARYFNGAGDDSFAIGDNFTVAITDDEGNQ